MPNDTASITSPELIEAKQAWPDVFEEFLGATGKDRRRVRNRLVMMVRERNYHSRCAALKFKGHSCGSCKRYKMYHIAGKMVCDLESHGGTYMPVLPDDICPSFEEMKSCAR